MNHCRWRSILSWLALTVVGGASPAALADVPNASFEQGSGTVPDAWTWTNPSPALKTEWTRGEAHTGQRAMRVRVPGELNTSSAWTLTCTTPISVVPGDYVASFWLKARCDRLVLLSIDGYHGDKRVKARLGDEPGAYCRQGGALGFGPCDWTRFQKGFTVPRGVSSLRLAFLGKHGSDLLIDDVEICPGQPPYQPVGKRVAGNAKNRVEEKMDRGMVATRCDQGVYVGWRMLRQDPANIAFRLYRQAADGPFVPASASPITKTADLVDTAPEAARAVAYKLCVVDGPQERQLAVCPVETCEPGLAYHAIKLQWPGNPPTGDVEKVGIGDLDGDGRDEVALGSMVLDDDGVPLWSTGKGHPDGLFIGDIDPNNPGLEMFSHVETRCQTGGMLLVDAATGTTLWELDTPTSHVHGGMCDDVDPDQPGLECYAVDKRTVNGQDQIVGTWFRSAAGKTLEPPTDWSYRRTTIYWDADLQRELIFGRTIRKSRGAGQWSIPRHGYHSFVPVDLLSDWREELLEFTATGRLRIHFSAVPACDRRVCLMQDRIYRGDIAMCAQAYHRPAMLSYCPAAKK